jgi:hypothetical protein
MKRLSFFIIISIAFIILTKISNAQVIKVGGGMELRTNPPVGLIAKATYDLDIIDENLGSSLDFMLIPELEANLDIHYSFVDDFGINAYGLGGLNYGNDLGINVGGGFIYHLTDQYDAFGEVKYIIKGNPEASIKLGILYYL